MTAKEILSSHDVLAQAIAQAIVQASIENERTRLSDVRFGRYSEAGAGWWWEISFTYSYGNSSLSRSEPEGIVQQVAEIIRRWAEDTAKYPEPEAADASD